MKTADAHDLFWLARYAHNKLAPVFAELCEIEPTAALNIELTFGDLRYHKPWHLTIGGHWGRPGMILQAICVTTSEEVERCADRVRDVIAKLRAEAAA